MKRRSMLQVVAAAAGAPAMGASASAATGGTVYARLGVKPVVNAMGTVTVLGGSLMPPEVVRAMEEASRHFVSLPDLQEKAGARIAELVGVPAALVTSGAAAAITVATAAAMTKGDPEKIAQLPDTTGLPFEVIQQGRSGYEAQVRVAGARVVTVETREELDRALSERTAMMFYLNYAEPKVRIKRDEWIRVARERGVVSFNDAAADVPPREHLSQYVREGFDLVAFSGGKGLRGPQCSGLLLGRKDLIEGARTLVAPHGGIGRGMKVGKEEIVGLVAAVERYMRLDLEKERRDLAAKVDHLKDVVGKVKGVAVETKVPEIANHVPHLVASWDETALGLTAKDVHERLREGDPPIHVLLTGPGTLTVSVWTMQGDEHRFVARRLLEILGRAGR
ncbi:MAG TPA: aminotransferase class V-fold PLP-dependent enzyme [Vicinamibacteria bacterium]